MRERSAVEVFLTFLKLGVSSFGGPIAHLGYFRQEVVDRRRWVDDTTFTDVVALCQFLPGPASSQVVFSLGLIRAGYWGAIAAWTAFTLPSALLMTAFAFGVGLLTSPIGIGVIHGLKLVAVAIVAQAVWGMAARLCPDRPRASIACISTVILLFSSASIAQAGVILFGAIAGFWLCRTSDPMQERRLAVPVSRGVAASSLTVFFGLLLLLPVFGARLQGAELFDAFYRSGALVFGGGHVVLPLLSKAFVTPGWVSQDSFLAGYAAAQALPGPVFTFAAYLGAISQPPPHGIAGAILGIVAIFLPGMLILLGTIPFWEAFRRRVGAQAVMRGVNAAVVGLLGAALYSLLWVNSVRTAADFALALMGFVLLTAWRAPPLLVVILGALGGIALS
jgi:chromate transporter